jgi:hypothetical protein
MESFGQCCTDSTGCAGDHRMSSVEVHVPMVSRGDTMPVTELSGPIWSQVSEVVQSGPPAMSKEHSMTETNEAVIHEALTVIDKALAQMMQRVLVYTGEVTDVLLDVRTLLTAPAHASH